MGRTVSPCTSLRITIGAFVEGSTIRPRIFISISIWMSPPFRRQPLLPDCSDSSLSLSPEHNYPGRKNRLARRKVQGFVLGSAPHHLASGPITTFNHHFKYLAYMIAVIYPLNFPLLVKQNLQSL